MNLVTGKGAVLSIIGITWLFLNIEIPKRAFRLYEKGDLEKTVEALEKSLEKDTLNPAARYLYARLYTDTAFWGYNVDTSYLYINEAIRDYGHVSEAKDLADLREVGVDSLSLELHKDLVDSLQFALITARHTIEAYNWFMTKHADAGQVPEAIRLRDHIAFEDASKEDSWQSYKQFMDEYPKAEDFEEAESRYKKLIFEARTADGKLKSYTDFLEEFPGTPYRHIAEQEIFEITTAVNTLEAYTYFLRNYPNQNIAKTVLPRLYPLYKEKYGSEGFLDHFELPTLRDSLEKVISLEDGYWLPRLDENQYTFFDENGEKVALPPLSSVDATYKCSPLMADYVVGSQDGTPKIFGRNGALIYEGPFNQVSDQGYGFLALEDTRGVRLIHKSGEVIIDEPQQSLAVLNQHFIRFQQNDLYGITTINQKQILAPEFDLIDTLLHYIWLEKDGKIALIEPEVLFPALDGEEVSLNFPYEEVELIDDSRLWVVKEGQEGILDDQLNMVVPFDNHTIYEREYGWVIEKEGKRKMLHSAYPFLKDIYFNKLLENNQWIAAKKDSSWRLIDRLGKLPMAENYDSLSFWGENMVMLFKGDSVVAQFRNGKQLLMDDEWKPSLLLPQNYIKTGEPALFDFFMLTNAKKYRKVYNSKGREILSATYNEVSAMGPNLLRLQKRNTALVDSTGNFVLNFIYDGVGSYDRGYVSIVKDGKVGTVNVAKKLTIPPGYEGLINPYSDTVLIARQDGLMGFINDENEQLSGFDFDEVKYWNDSIALVRIEKEWYLHHIPSETGVYEGILAYEYLKNDESEKRLLVTKESGKGIYSSSKGEIIEATYDDIKMLGTEEKPIYFTVKIVEEANIYVVIYYDADGNKLFTLTYRQDQYFDIVCADK